MVSPQFLQAAPLSQRMRMPGLIWDTGASEAYFGADFPAVAASISSAL